MVLTSPSISAAANLAYWAPENDGRQQLDAEAVPEHPQQQEGEGGKKDTRSMYVQLFECA